MQIIVTLKASKRWLLMRDQALPLLWEVVRAGFEGQPNSQPWTTSRLLWLEKGVHRSYASSVWPKDVGGPLKGPGWERTGTIDVVVPVEPSSMDLLKPVGLRRETLIVMNENGTWSPTEIWVGEALSLWERS